MQPASYKSIFRKYYLACILIILIYISFVAFCICVYPNIWSVIFCTILYCFPVKMFIRISANEIITSVLFRDLNAQQFNQIITSNKHFIPPLSYRLNAAFFIGNYQTVVNIAFCQIQKRRCSVNIKVFYLSLLARVYFELRDFDKLNLILNKYDELKALYPSKKLFNTANSIWSYYRYFLDGNFEACKTVCRERLLELNSKSWDAKIRKLNNDFEYAVACYENGDKNDAIKSFESIVAYAPHMNSSELSKKYIVAIQTDSEISLFSEIIPNDSVKVEEGKIHEKKRKLLILSNIGWALIIVSAVIYIFPRDSKDPNAEYAKQLHNIVDEHYEDFSILGYSNAEFDDVVVDTIVLVYTEKEIDVVSYVSYADGKKTVIKRIPDMQKDVTYSFESTMGTHMIYVSLLDEETLAEQKTKISFEVEKKDMVFVVDQIVPLS